MINDIYLVCFYGPESTGKTTMAEMFAKKYGTHFVPEVGREIISSNDTLTLDEIILTGKTQVERTTSLTQTANRILFCDSDLITTQIYSHHYLNEIPPILYDLEAAVSFDRYFLFDIDVPWVDDGVRDLGSDADRKLMYQRFSDELKKRGIEPVHVRGTWEERIAIVETSIKTLLLSR